MKPTFALNFTDTSIALLHRTAKGWVKVGETPFDTPDLTEALDYLRNTALGMAPGGFTTKLVIPNSQLLYAEIDTSGTPPKERRARIAAALEERTGLKAEEIAFDFSGKGDTVQVVAVDRQTLDEAEGFATQHRFEPVAFVAIPAGGGFDAEPWFGPAGSARALPPNKAAALRDKSSIVILDAPGTRPAARDAAPDREAPAEATPAEPLPDLLTGTDAPAPPAVAPGLEVKAPALADTRRQAPAADDLSPEPGPVHPAVARREAPALPTPPEDLLSSLAARTGDDAAVPAGQEAPAALPAAGDDRLPPETGPETGPGRFAAPARPAAPFAEERGEEAPFAHVTDTTAFPEAGFDDDDLPPPAAATGRAAATVADDDDLPPAPPEAARAAFAARRGPDLGLPPRAAAGGLGGTGGTGGTGAARPDAATLARAARGKPVEDLPPMPRPPQAGARPPLPGPRPAVAARPAAPLVTAPSIPGTRKVKAKPMPTVAAGVAPVTASPGDAARSLGRSPFANRPAQRGRPRHLGLILTVILLVCLALVAAWSSFYLTARDPDPSAPDTASDVASADGPLPGVEDEMLADGEDPAALAAESADAGATALPEAEPDATAETVAAPDPDSAPEPAPDTGAQSGEGPVASALLDQQDEIFLATNEAPPPAFDALALPPVDAAADSLPPPPMPPPEYGTVYRFDENGLLLPTPEGILSPEGVLLIAGKPPILPPPRSAAAEAAAAEASGQGAPADGTGTVEGAGTEAAGPTALIEGLPGAAETAGATADQPPAAQPDPDLADRRPRARPADLKPAASPANPDDALLDTAQPTAVTSLRPRPRPQSVLAAVDRARAETAGASLAAAADAGAQVVAAAAPAGDPSNPSLLAISRRPAEKPEDFSRAVEAAVAAAVRMPDPAPPPAAKAPDLKPEEQDEIDEPEVASAAPKIPTKASVAKQATFVNALNLSKVNLIGVYGTQSKRYALIRLSSGKYKKVRVGDRIDGGTVKAITQSEVRYQKGGRLIALKMPKG